MTTRPIDIRPILHGSSEYDLEIALRTEILRKPLGLQFLPSDLAQEENDLHLGAFSGEQLIGCLLLVSLPNQVMKMRQVAIAAEAQGTGIGQILVRASEDLARARGFKKIELNARDTAIKFYEKLGYQAVGEPFIEVKIPHQKMIKQL